LQPKLLKALEDKRFRRLGEVRDRQVDVQLIVASHHDLGALVREARFRSDLYFRISAIPLRVPPLRERREDIPMLARGLLEAFGAELGRREVRLAEGAEQALQKYSWPGNVRELRNVLERAVLMSGRQEIRASDVQFDSSAATPPATGSDTGLTLAELEKRHIEAVLAETGGRVPEAARRLGVARSTLYDKLKRLGLAGGDESS
jgi:DNA-binding NtrC family response regulator